MYNRSSIPWVEKYRPNSFNTIILDPINKDIIANIIETDSFPNLLLYGPPGTGKTTTIMNLINSYQVRYNQKNKGLIIHFNASDERGIDIIRNQVCQFVNSEPLFTEGLKLVVLDEVDYMTKNAQQALKYLLQDYHTNVRFCLICNYISRIDDSLQNELMHLRFNNLPGEKIIDFLSNICIQEKIQVSPVALVSIQQLFKSDIRSMINYLQSNQSGMEEKKVLDNAVWETFTSKICLGVQASTNYMNTIQILYDIDDRVIIKYYIEYLITNKREILCKEFLNFGEYILHTQYTNMDYLRNYFITFISTWIHK